jgi:hypothetical protein
MAVKVQFEVSSDNSCQIPVIGEFAPGETKVLTDYQVELFEKIYGYKIGKAKFAPSVHFAVKVGDFDKTEEV